MSTKRSSREKETLSVDIMSEDQKTPSKEMELEEVTNKEKPTIPVNRLWSDNDVPGKREDEQDLRLVNSTPNLPAETAKRQVSILSDETKPRTSTQAKRKSAPRKSSEFDRRTDGPYGRPSLTMSRRGSTQAGNDAAVVDELPAVPAQYVDGEPAESADSRTAIPFQLEPPPLNYDLWSRRWWILAFWSLVVFDSVVCPVVSCFKACILFTQTDMKLALYFGLWYGLYLDGKMSANTVFSIVTAAVGGMSIIEYFLRLWKLVKKNSRCRVIGAKWWWADSFHWNFTLGWIIIMAELIAGTVQENPPPRLITMVVPTMLYVFAIELLVLDALRYFEVPAPIRLSSIPTGAQVRPGIYTIIEDVVAVDGSGGTDYREALNTRYEASHVFRAMLRRLGLFWSVGSMSMATVCTILIFAIDNVDAAYTIGWSLPFIWAGVWALITIWYVKKKLREEKVAWREELEAKNSSSV